MQTEAEYAELYTQAEKIRLVCVGTLIGAALIFLTRSYLLPWFNHFVETAPCRKVLGIDGLTVLWNGIFVAMPVFFALTVAATFGWRGYKILRDHQFPPRNEKVCKPTKIRRGNVVRFIAWLHFFPVVILLLIAVWGSFQVDDMPKKICQTRSTK
ncbi:hypothetical protein [Chitinibacter sp. S2-10]|uniref:hypothetical protein n=1 Tax=Chitinibacter sp. S2-10 TaxID=3373597 RepID=UPI00397793FB